MLNAEFTAPASHQTRSRSFGYRSYYLLSQLRSYEFFKQKDNAAVID